LPKIEIGFDRPAYETKSFHSRVRAKTKSESEWVGKYMIRPLLSLERLSFMEPEGKVGYRHGQGAGDQETMDYLEFIARVTSHIPDKGQVMVRYYGLYANAHRGKVRKASLTAFPLRIVEDELQRVPSKGWATMIRKVYEVDPMVCPKCGGQMKVVAFLTEYAVVDRIIDSKAFDSISKRVLDQDVYGLSVGFEAFQGDVPAKASMSRVLLLLDFDHRQRIQFFCASEYAFRV